MIIKEADGRSDDIAELERLLQIAPSSARERISTELRNVRAGVSGENQSAYMINFKLKDSKSTAVLHDLRLELPNGNVAQIDHLLVHKTFRFYVLETKRFHAGVKIHENGAWERWNNFKKCYEGMESPVEQNKRHIDVLRHVLKGLQYPDPVLESFILIPGTARIFRPKSFKTDFVVKADQFIEQFDRDLMGQGFFSAVSGLLSTAVSGNIETIGRQLAALHKPIVYNYQERFGIPASTTTSNQHLNPLVQPDDIHSTVPTAPAVKPADVPELSCKKCHSTKVRLADGKNGKYIRCNSCNTNSALCVDASHRVTSIEVGGNLYVECKTCGQKQTLAVCVDHPVAIPAKNSNLTSSPVNTNSHAIKSVSDGPKCKKCGNKNVAIEWGKWGYYFKCGSCGGNTAINVECSAKGHKAKLRKSGQTFFTDCDYCKSSEFFFENR